jgi:hypothetical protein
MTVPMAPVRLLAGVAFSVVAAGVALFVPTAAAIGIAADLAADPVRFGLVITGLYLVRPLFVLPTTPLAVLVGYGYRTVLGIPVAVAGVVVTVVPVFVVARWLLNEDGSRTPGPLTTGRPAALLSRADRLVDRYYATAGPFASSSSHGSRRSPWTSRRVLRPSAASGSISSCWGR